MEAVMTQEWRNQGQSVLTWRDNKRRKMAFSVCGYISLRSLRNLELMSDLRTNSYMSPEVIRGMGYGFSCDWWSLGVIGELQEHLSVYYLRLTRGKSTQRLYQLSNVFTAIHRSSATP